MNEYIDPHILQSIHGVKLELSRLNSSCRLF